MRDRQSIFFSLPGIDFEGNGVDECQNDDHGESSEQPSGNPSDTYTEDPLGIGLLNKNFEHLVEKINERVKLLSSQVLQSVQGEQYAIQKNQIQKSDHEIKRLKQLIAQCEEFELDFQKISQIGDFAKEFKSRILALEKDM